MVVRTEPLLVNASICESERLKRYSRKSTAALKEMPGEEKVRMSENRKVKIQLPIEVVSAAISLQAVQVTCRTTKSRV